MTTERAFSYEVGSLEPIPTTYKEVVTEYKVLMPAPLFEADMSCSRGPLLLRLSLVRYV